MAQSSSCWITAGGTESGRNRRTEVRVLIAVMASMLCNLSRHLSQAPSVKPRHQQQCHKVVECVSHNWCEEIVLGQEQPSEIQAHGPCENGVGAAGKMYQAEHDAAEHQRTGGGKPRCKPDLEYSAEQHLFAESGHDGNKRQVHRGQ